ncbi:MAG: alpha/beta hydrolase, partial [Flavobacteriales bacterium]|nr:alpha/beta hydrolase [Flavobacteriales bacterium]
SEAINNLFTSENLLKHKEEVARLKQIGVNTGLNGAAPALRGMAERSDMLGKLNQLQIPVLFIAGRFDNIIPIESVIDQVNQLNASLVILEKSSHMGFVEEYELTLSTLVKFWNSVKVLT